MHYRVFPWHKGFVRDPGGGELRLRESCATSDLCCSAVNRIQMEIFIDAALRARCCTRATSSEVIEEPKFIGMPSPSNGGIWPPEEQMRHREHDKIIQNISNCISV
jgi:hypothetical protein